MGDPFIPGRPGKKTMDARAQKGGGGAVAVEEELKKIIPRIEELEKIPKALEALAAQLKKAEFVISILVASKK
tara:strand:+ start:98 stop:316 length:219 start_codon:yes stop_codon:yes gene_type:complete